MARFACALAVLLAPAIALACSGPGAMDRMEAEEQRGWILFAVSAVIVVGTFVFATIRTRKVSYQIPLLLVLLLHPGWCMSARHGDCGRLLHTASTAVTIATPVLCGLAYWLLRRAARKAADPNAL